MAALRSLKQFVQEGRYDSLIISTQKQQEKSRLQNQTKEQEQGPQQPIKKERYEPEQRQDQQQKMSFSTVETKMKDKNTSIGNSNSNPNSSYHSTTKSSPSYSSSSSTYFNRQQRKDQVALIKALPIKSLTVQCINECYSLPYEENRITLCFNFYCVLRLLTPKLFDKRKAIIDPTSAQQRTKSPKTTGNKNRNSNLAIKKIENENPIKQKEVQQQQQQQQQENIPSSSNTILSSTNTSNPDEQSRASIFAESFPFFPFEELFSPKLVVYFKNCFGFVEVDKLY